MSSGTRDDPWKLQTPSLQSDIEAYRDTERSARARRDRIEDRGPLGNCVPPVLEALGRAELEHNARNNRIRAI